MIIEPSEQTLRFLSELTFDASAPAPSMGTRRLGARPWLLPVAADEGDLLERRRRLVEARRDEVVAVDAVPIDVGGRVLDLVREDPAWAGADPSGPDHPLVAAGVGVVEDLCVLRRTAAGWELTGAVLAFPSSWHLGEKIGRVLLGVHGPVPGYADRLHDRVESLLDRLDDQVVWRRNWFLHADDEWFQPDRPDPDHVVTGDEIDDRLWIRSERQTLRSLGDLEGDEWALFTIRIQHTPIGRAWPSVGADLAGFLRAAAPDRLRRHGVHPAQHSALLAWSA